MKTPKPRTETYYEMPTYTKMFTDGTWVEAEEFAYPSGGFHRRARAKCEDGKIRIVRCSIPDTFFSIPARAVINRKLTKGFLTTDEQGVRFTANQF